MAEFTRRKFLGGAAAAIGAAASDVLALDLLAPVYDPLGAYPYRGWETLYQDQWRPDSFGRTTHSANCTGSCTWKGYIKNGILFKEEQYADFPDITGCPTYNPRGCQKGANYKEYVYGPQRVKYPLIRAGARGQGNWRREAYPGEAYDIIAQRVVDAIQDPLGGGPDTVSFFAAIPAKHHITLAGGFRLANLIGGVVCSFYDWYCDLPPGEPMTWGVQTDSCESADWFNSKYIMLQGANLLETRIPDAHFLAEARANGARVVVVAPEYNPVSIHADLFVPIKPGTDAALCLGMVREIIRLRLHDQPYIKKFTDLPFLVRTDNGKFLRESDLVPGGSPEKFFVWDTVTGSAVLAPGTLGDPVKTLELGAVDPALEGVFTVGTLQLTTVFSLLKTKLETDYTPAQVAAITGVGASMITQLAQEFATTPPARIIEGAGTNHYYHNDLINRAQILLVAVTGNVGVQGGGFDHYVGQEKLWAEHGFFQLSFPHGRPKQRFQNTTLWTYVHSEVTSDVDALWPKTLRQYIQQSVDQNWMPLYPKGPLDPANPAYRRPRVLFVWGANYLNQAKGASGVFNTLWPKLDLVVDINFRMDTTALYADIVLPAASWYEKWDLSTTDLHTFVHPFTPVISPLWESKTDWQHWRGIAAAIQATGFAFTDNVPDGTTIVRDFSTLGNDFDHLNVASALAGVASDQDACQFLLDNSVETAGLTLPQIATKPQRFLATADEWTSDITSGAYFGFQRMKELKRPLSTLTGRQQFYIDQDLFLTDFGEALPIYKPPVDADDPVFYPLRWITPHGRWSIHSTWRDAKYQLRLQRGRPIVYLSPAEALGRGLSDNDAIRVFNSHGSFIAHLCISPRLPNGMAQMYHGWEKYFMDQSWQSPTTVRIKPTQLVGGYAQLKFRLNYWGPTGNQKDTRVQIEKFTG